MDLKSITLLVSLIINVLLCIYGYRVHRMYFKEKIYRMTLENIIGHYKSISRSEIENYVVDEAVERAFERTRKGE